MNLIQIENALQKARACYNAVQKQLTQSESKAAAAEEKAALAKKNYKQAKKDAKHARKVARLENNELAKARETAAERLRMVKKVEGKLLKAREKTKGKSVKKPKTPMRTAAKKTAVRKTRTVAAPLTIDAATMAPSTVQKLA
jgi:hypothetical protein